VSTQPPSRGQIVSGIGGILGVPRATADTTVRAFEEIVAKPLQQNLTKLKGRDLAKTNPMIYTVRGTRTVRDWLDRVLEDKETSAVEAHIGTWMEEVAVIISGGVKAAVRSTSSGFSAPESSSCTRFTRPQTQRTLVGESRT
jgi:hypothetical protein